MNNPIFCDTYDNLGEEQIMLGKYKYVETSKVIHPVVLLLLLTLLKGIRLF